MKDSIRYLFIVLTGLLFGIFVFLPINELTSYYEYNSNLEISVWQFVGNQLWKALTFVTPVKFFFYLIFGGIMGLISLISLINYKKANHLIFQLRHELDKDLPALIRKGEDDNLEFKSSFRYDYKLQKINKALESVIIKTIAGFMNTRGGSLLIGLFTGAIILSLGYKLFGMWAGENGMTKEKENAEAEVTEIKQS